MKNKLRIIFKHSSIIVSLILVVLVSLMSIGYAFYSSELQSIGIVNLDLTSNLDCVATSLTNGDNSNTTYISSSYTNQEHKNKSIITSNVYGIFSSGSLDYMTMIINIKNTSSVEQTFVNFSSSSTLNSDGSILPAPRMLNLAIGDVLKPNESRDVKVIYYYKGKISDQKSFEANFRFVFEDGVIDVNEPKLVGIIDDKMYEVDNVYVSSNVSIANNFNVSVKYYLRVDNMDGSVTLVDSDYKESNYSSILNTGENEAIPITFKVKFGSKSEIKTKLYIETENGEIYDIEELTFDKPMSEQSIIPIGISVSDYSNMEGSSYSIWLEADNSANDKDLEDYSIVVKFKDGSAIKSIDYDGTGLALWNAANWTYTINGINQFIMGRPHHTISANTKERFGILKVDFFDELNSISDYIEYVVVKGEVNEPEKSDAHCKYNDQNEFVCSDI